LTAEIDNFRQRPIAAEAVPTKSRDIQALVGAPSGAKPFAMLRFAAKTVPKETSWFRINNQCNGVSKRKRKQASSQRACRRTLLIRHELD
jgi:alkylated DNA nucleotide flippase Atl1